MAKKGYIKNKSIYTIKKFHSKTNEGTIFENDHITIIPNDGIYNEDMVLFSDSNFKYRVGKDNNDSKKHIKSSWIKPENSDNEIWTLNNIINKGPSNESKIVINPNYNSLKDFAYYGSAVELLKGTVNNIMLNFPGGLYFYQNDDIPSMWVGDDEYYVISNDYEIDCWTDGKVSPDALKNPMRVLSSSYMHYTDGNGKDINKPEINISNSCVGSIIGNVKVGDYTLLIYLGENGKKTLLCEKDIYLKNEGKTIIKSKEKFLDKFWLTLTDFERVLLNRNTTPVYKAEFETPYTNETGYFYKIKSYIWPTINNDGITPDISSGKFQTYIQSLINLAEFHDEHDSDNIWRMMTHEAIKNLDWTFTTKDGEDDGSIDDIDSSRIKMIVNIQGQMYDNLKTNIDNIKNTINVSYDNKSNVPDYFLSDLIENNGWEAKTVSNFSATTDEIIYSNDSIKSVIEKAGKNNSYVNSNFYKRLLLNSKYIKSMKGTRRGLEATIGMFGYNYKESPINKGEYSITEYVVNAVGEYPTYCETSYLRALFDYVNNDENTNFMAGYPVAKVEMGDNSDGYLIPWFNKDIKYKHPFYFQSKGGWGKMSEKYICKPNLTTVNKIEGKNIYDETSPYMIFVKNIQDMTSLSSKKLFSNIICYVEDITNMNYQDEETETDVNEYSHYFILKNVDLSTRLGFVESLSNYDNGCYGWRNIRKREYDGSKTPTEDGNKVLYLESLIIEERGNNSHTGKGKYDDGIDYFKRFKYLFLKDIEDGVLKKIDTDEDKIGIENAGFELSGYVENNKKCHYFGDYLKANNRDNLNEGVFYNPEQKKWDRNEESANSIINTKHLSIRFIVNGDEEMKQYIKNTIFKYVYEMIPSTTIIELLFDDENSNFNRPDLITLN